MRLQSEAVVITRAAVGEGETIGVTLQEGAGGIISW